MEAQSPTLPLACVLSPGEYAQRMREFRRLFAAALRDHRREPNRLYLVLDKDGGREEATRDLLRREQECCPHFNFNVAATGDAVIVDAGVPAGAESCLDDLERMAARAAAGRRA
jgi:ATP-binding cassette, subfamily B, bacterial